MSEKIHLGARTTPATRKEIQNSKETIYRLAKKYNVSRPTILRWKNSPSVYNKKSGPEPHSKHLSKAQEVAIVAFRMKTRLGLDDCLQAFKKEIPKLKRSALYLVFRRHNVNNLTPLNSKKKEKKLFKQYDPGYVHVDITQVYTEEGKLYLFVGIDRTTKFCFVRFYDKQTAANAVTFLEEMYAAFPNKIGKILTDNGKQFTTHHVGRKDQHIFTQTCTSLDIEHRLTLPYHPWTNGQVERMNRTLKEATIKKFYYKSHGLLKKNLYMFVDSYNYATKLKAIGYITPYEKVCLYLQSEEGKPYLNPTNKSPEPYSGRVCQ